ncbi:MAG: hypothetical protein IAE67_03305 [Candidatus Competibacteraceae bacterium]|nr:hypothetical protein [Candidatus Competibacteraceae bacterium]
MKYLFNTSLRMIISTLRVGPAQSTGQGWREFAAGQRAIVLGFGPGATHRWQ